MCVQYVGNMNFLCQGFWKLSSDRQTDRQNRPKYEPRRFAGGQKHYISSVSHTVRNLKRFRSDYLCNIIDHSTVSISCGESI